MNHDVGLTATEFGWGAGILFVGYYFFWIPSNLALQRFGARRWLSRIMITCGASLRAHRVRGRAIPFSTRPGSAGRCGGRLFSGRRLPGHGLVSGAVSDTRAGDTGSGSALSSVIGGPFSVLLLEMNGYCGLREVAVDVPRLQGLPACILGILALLTLCDHPKDAHWLTPAERAALDFHVEC